MLFLRKVVHHRDHHKVTVIIITLKAMFKIPIRTIMPRFNHTKGIILAPMNDIYHPMLDLMKNIKHRFAICKAIPITMYPPGQLRTVLLPTIQVITPLAYQVHLFTAMWLPVGYLSMRTFSVKPIILLTGTNLP